MNILVFGKDGQLGKAFKALFDELPSAVNTVITYFGRGDCDLTNKTQVTERLNTIKPDLIINAAAYTAVDKAEIEIDLAYTINAKAPELMAQYAVENAATLLHFSTDYVFDGTQKGFYLETDTCNPLGIYGKSKLAGEQAIERIFANASCGQYAIFRTSWVYGDGGNFIRTILRLAKEREELRVIHDQHGVPTSAQWLAQTTLDVALDSQLNLKQFPSGVYHAVPSGETTWHGLASFAVQSAMNAGVGLKTKPPAIKPILALEYPLPAPRPMNSRMDTSKLRTALQNGLSKPSNSYNESQYNQVFPSWEGMVQEYVSDLASRGLI
jgi:dTDP-4-dehydrorhamnose reductase